MTMRHAGSRFTPAPGLRLVKKNTTEATTTSVTATDGISVTGLSIPTTVPIEGQFLVRKTSGAAAGGGFGLKINSTVVFEAGTGSFSTTDQAERFLVKFYIPPRVSNYLGAGRIEWGGTRGSNSPATSQHSWDTADLPNAVITSITARLRSGNALITIGSDEMFIWTLPE